MKAHTSLSGRAQRHLCFFAFALSLPWCLKHDRSGARWKQRFLLASLPCSHSQVDDSDFGLFLIQLPNFQSTCVPSDRCRCHEFLHYIESGESCPCVFLFFSLLYLLKQRSWNHFSKNCLLSCCSPMRYDRLYSSSCQYLVIFSSYINKDHGIQFNPVWLMFFCIIYYLGSDPVRPAAGPTGLEQNSTGLEFNSPRGKG